MNSIRVEDSQFERKFISIGNREYEMIETNVKSFDESKKMKAKRTRSNDVTAHLNYLQMPVKIDM